MGMVNCSVCNALRDTHMDNVECCADCGEWVCTKHVVFVPRSETIEEPLCPECGVAEATRQMKAAAPGVWPEWAESLSDQSGPR